MAVEDWCKLFFDARPGFERIFTAQHVSRLGRQRPLSIVFRRLRCWRKCRCQGRSPRVVSVSESNRDAAQPPLQWERPQILKPTGQFGSPMRQTRGDLRFSETVPMGDWDNSRGSPPSASTSDRIQGRLHFLVRLSLAGTCYDWRALLRPIKPAARRAIRVAWWASLGVFPRLIGYSDCWQRKLFREDVEQQPVNALVWSVALKEDLVVAAQSFGQGRRNSGGATHSRVAV